MTRSQAARTLVPLATTAILLFTLLAPAAAAAGDVSAVYVSVLGSPSGDGTSASPLRDPAAGVAMALAQGKTTVILSSGVFALGAGGLAVGGDLTIRGGLDPATWTPTSAPTVLRGTTQAVLVEGAHHVVLERLTLEGVAADVHGSSVYGLRALGHADVRLVDVDVRAGDAREGARGAQGSEGAAGTPGQPGGIGGCSVPFRHRIDGFEPPIVGLVGRAGNGAVPGRDGGRGGQGKVEFFTPELFTYYGDGDDGESAAGTGFGWGGQNGYPGGHGRPGLGRNVLDHPERFFDGRSGLQGRSATSGALSASTSGWVSRDHAEGGTAGSRGVDGYGGGGGGGNSDFFIAPHLWGTGGGGGGGGAAGTGGGGGGPGGNGGASIAIFAGDSTVRLEAGTRLASGAGGAGGDGGASGPGGIGGQGGAGGDVFWLLTLFCPGKTPGGGGDGGQGGNGGAGGRGGGGAGGPSVGFYGAGTGSLVRSCDSTLLAGAPGTGGVGGAAYGDEGGADGFGAVQWPSTPPHDAFARSVALTTGEGDVCGDNVGATVESGETLPQGIFVGSSVWYTWTAPLAGRATFETAGSSFDTHLAAYTGTSLTDLVEVAANDDSGGTTASSMTFPVEPGTTYRIRLDVARGDPGAFRLAWRMHAPGEEPGFCTDEELAGCAPELGLLVPEQVELPAAADPGPPAPGELPGRSGDTPAADRPEPAPPAAGDAPGRSGETPAADWPEPEGAPSEPPGRADETPAADRTHPEPPAEASRGASSSHGPPPPPEAAAERAATPARESEE